MFCTLYCGNITLQWPFKHYLFPIFELFIFRKLLYGTFCFINFWYNFGNYFFFFFLISARNSLDLSIRYSKCYCWCCGPIAESYIQKSFVARERNSAVFVVFLSLRVTKEEVKKIRRKPVRVFFICFDYDFEAFFFQRSARSIFGLLIFCGDFKRMRRYLSISRRFLISVVRIKSVSVKLFFSSTDLELNFLFASQIIYLGAIQWINLWTSLIHFNKLALFSVI